MDLQKVQQFMTQAEQLAAQRILVMKKFPPAGSETTLAQIEAIERQEKPDPR